MRCVIGLLWHCEYGVSVYELENKLVVGCMYLSVISCIFVFGYVSCYVCVCFLFCGGVCV